MPNPRTLAALKVSGSTFMATVNAIVCWHLGGLLGLATGMGAVWWMWTAAKIMDEEHNARTNELAGIGQNVLRDIAKARNMRRFVGEGPPFYAWTTYADTDGRRWRVTVEEMEQEAAE